jgi:GxxExxY protein
MKGSASTKASASISSSKTRVIVELKCVERLDNAHKKQLLTYLRLADKRLGYLLNFGEALMRDGIFRAVNGFPDDRS